MGYGFHGAAACAACFHWIELTALKLALVLLRVTGGVACYVLLDGGAVYVTVLRNGGVVIISPLGTRHLGARCYRQDALSTTHMQAKVCFHRVSPPDMQRQKRISHFFRHRLPPPNFLSEPYVGRIALCREFKRIRWRIRWRNLPDRHSDNVGRISVSDMAVKQPVSVAIYKTKSMLRLKRRRGGCHGVT